MRRYLATLPGVGIRVIQLEDNRLTMKTLLGPGQSFSSFVFSLAMIGVQKEFSLGRGSPRYRDEVRFKTDEKSRWKTEYQYPFFSL